MFTLPYYAPRLPSFISLTTEASLTLGVLVLVQVLCLAAEVLENRQLTRDYGELARDFHELKRTGSKLLQLGAAVEVNRRTMDPESFRRRGSIVA